MKAKFRGSIPSDHVVLTLIQKRTHTISVEEVDDFFSQIRASKDHNYMVLTRFLKQSGYRMALYTPVYVYQRKQDQGAILQEIL